MKKAAFHNLGCKVNAYETDVMEESLVRAGYEIVPFEEEADVYHRNKYMERQGVSFHD